MPIEPSELLIGQISASEIKEFVHGFPTSHRTDSFANGACDLEMTFKVPGAKLKPFLQWTLGVNYMDGDNNLRRSLPMFHPVHCWAWARSVRVSGQQYDGDDADAVIWDFQVTPAKWKQYECVVAFDIPKFPLYADDEIDTEDERFLSIDMSPETQVVTVENGQVHYDGLASGVLWDDQPHSATVPIGRKIGAGFTAKWWHVPEEFVQASQIDVPEKFMIATGRCNSATFFSKTTETVLLAHVERERYVSPVMTDQVGRPYFLNDITFKFMYTTQLAAEVGDAAETRRGWNMLLGPQMKYWYTRNVVSGLPVVPTIDFTKLFTHHLDAYT